MIYLYIGLITLSPYLAILPAALSGVHVLLRGGYIFKNDWNNGLMFLFFWAVFVGIINMDKISTLASIFIFCYFLLGVFLQNYCQSEKKAEKLFKIVLGFSTGSAVIGLLERFTTLHNDPTWWKRIMGIYPQVLFYDKYRISGTSGNPNVAGTWYAVMVLIAIYFFIRSTGFRKLFYAGITGLFCAVLMMTSSRGATLGLGAGILGYIYFSGRKKDIRSWILPIAIAFIAVFACPRIFQRGDTLDSSIIDRLKIWLNCLNMFKLKPFTGWGIMGIYFADGDVYQYIRTFHGHNIWITLATTLGVVGLGVFLYLQGYIFEQINLLRDNSSKLVPLLAGIQLLIMGQGLMDFTIMNPQGGIIFFGCSAIITALAAQYSTVPVESYSFAPLKSKNRYYNS